MKRLSYPKTDRCFVLVFIMGMLGCGAGEEQISDRVSAKTTDSPMVAQPAVDQPPPPVEMVEKTMNPVSESPQPNWGDLTVRFVYDGDPPQSKELDVSKEPFCTMHKPLDESLVVNPTNRGIANIVVSLYVKSDEKLPGAHSSYQELADAKVTVDNQGCRFEPHDQVVRAGQTLVISNSDPLGHNTKFDSFNNGSFNEQIPTGTTIEKRMNAAERYPVQIQCSVHPWMNGWLIIQDHPYVAVSDEDGNVALRNYRPEHGTFNLDTRIPFIYESLPSARRKQIGAARSR